MSAVAKLDRESERESERTGFTSPAQRDAALADGLVTGSSESSGVSSKGGSSRSKAPTEEQLLDVLYEVLVQGVPPRSTLTREQVEQFLHQHARQTKPVGEVLAFFEMHGLPTDPGDYGADRELGELASGLQKERNSLLTGFGPVEAQEPERLAQPLPQTLPPLVQAAVPVAVSVAPAPFVAALSLDNEKTGRRAPPVLRASAGMRWVVAVAVALAVAAMVAFALNYERATTLERRLDQARMQQRSTDVALSKLEQRAETLHGALKQSEADHLQQTTELKSTLEEQAKRRATDEQVVERLLGPRYLKLRQKYSDQAAAAPKPATP